MSAIIIRKYQRLFQAFNRQTSVLQNTGLRLCSSNSDGSSTQASATTKKSGPPELKEKEWQVEFHQKGKGKIAGKLPFKVSLKKGKRYSWCTCGYSHKQPLCDGTHRIAQLRIALKPMTFKAPEDMDVWLCMCKQSNNRPFCDGSHRCDEVQDSNVQ